MTQNYHSRHGIHKGSWRQAHAMLRRPLRGLNGQLETTQALLARPRVKSLVSTGNSVRNLLSSSRGFKENTRWCSDLSQWRRGFGLLRLRTFKLPSLLLLLAPSPRSLLWPLAWVPECHLVGVCLLLPAYGFTCLTDLCWRDFWWPCQLECP